MKARRPTLLIPPAMFLGRTMMETYRNYGDYIANSTRHRASTSMHSPTFCVRFCCQNATSGSPHSRLPQAGRRRAGRARFSYAARGFGDAPSPRRSPAGDSPGDARRPRPAGRSHYVVMSRDGRKLVTRVRVMLP